MRSYLNSRLVQAFSFSTISCSSFLIADINFDQIGPNDGSYIDYSAGVFPSQDFESSPNNYDIYDIVSADNFTSDTVSAISSIEFILDGWNGFTDPAYITGYSANLYTSIDAAGSSLIGDIDSYTIDSADAFISPLWEADGFLINCPVYLLSSIGNQFIGVLPINEFGINGQVGIRPSLLGDEVPAIQGNPGGGFGFGNSQEIQYELAYRLNTSVEDCNANGVADYLDILNGTSADCNANNVPDECEIFFDCNDNDIPDSCENFTDCNLNGIPDECDISEGASYDCDQNGIPDECQSDCDGDGFIDACDNDGDCDGDGIPDNCEVDCQPNGIPDDCDILLGISQDVNNDSIPDECQDCNKNSIPDPVDIDNGTSEDFDGNGIPDECQYPVTWTVDDDGKADFDNIQDAINAASSLPNLDEILVYPGTYSAGINMLGKEIRLYSSVGPEVTFIHGDGLNQGIVCESGETLNTVIEGFTFTKCYTYLFGGAIHITDESSATIKNCIFMENSVDGNGGAVAVTGIGATITDCHFINNSSIYSSTPGGALLAYNNYLSQPGSAEGEVVITGTSFCGNYPNAITGMWVDGGNNCIAFSCEDANEDDVPDQCGIIDDGVHYVPEEYSTIQEAIVAAGDYDEIIVGPGVYTECNTWSNEEEDTTLYAGIYLLGKRLWIHSSDGPEKTIIDCENYSLQTHGGSTQETIVEGFTFNAPAQIFLDSATFKNCIFKERLVIRGGDSNIESCQFEGNGYVEIYDFRSNNTFSESSFTNISIDSNQPIFDKQASQNFPLSDSVTIDRCEFKSNSLSLDDTVPLIDINGTDALILNSTFSYNQASSIISSFTNVKPVIIDSCLIQSNIANGIEGCDVLLSNTTICGNSYSQIACDDWTDGGGNTVLEVCFDDCQAADITDDGIVDVNDMLAILGYWGSSIPAGDIDGSGQVDISDMLMLISNWGSCS